MTNPEVLALRERLDAQAEELGPDALRPSVEEWERYFASRGIALTRETLDIALVALAGTMSTVAGVVVKAYEPKGRVTASKGADQRLAHVMDALTISAVALSQVVVANSPNKEVS